MKEETMKYIIDEILPNNRDALNKYIREQAKMVLHKMVEINDVKDRESMELEAMLIASTVQIGLIDECCQICGMKGLSEK